MHRTVGFASFVLAILTGCAASTEVRGADETETNSSSEAESTPAATATATAATATAATAACDAGDTRSCTQRYIDDYGTPHCMTTTQHCAEDGKDWLPCGVLPASTAATK